jgi:hypothetical protein
MAYFQTKNPNLGKFWIVLQWMILVYFMVIWPILLPFGKFCDHFGLFHGDLVTFSHLVCCNSKNLATLAPTLFFRENE